MTTDYAEPTLEQFVQHASKFGPELVAETACTYLTPAQLARLQLALVEQAGRNGTAGKRRRRTSNHLRDQVQALRERGLVPAAIADTLNVSDRRVADILGKSGRVENGGRKAPVQAKLFAD